MLEINKDQENLPEQKPIIIEELNDDEKTNLIYEYDRQIKNLQLELNYKSNPISLLAENAENLISLIKESADKWLQIKKTNLNFSTKMSVFASLIIIIIVGSAGLLTYLEKIDGSTFTFLLGLIIGYALTFLQNLINPD